MLPNVMDSDPMVMIQIKTFGLKPSDERIASFHDRHTGCGQTIAIVFAAHIQVRVWGMHKMGAFDRMTRALPFMSVTPFTIVCLIQLLSHITTSIQHSQ